MAKEDFAPLSATMEQQAKLPLYGASETQLKELKDAQEQALGALEQRYAQPNLFKVAAGFAKPQLGGFLASFGSAAEAMGENLEQQRAQQLPIAQMRAQLAQTNLLMGQNKTVSDMLAERRAKGQPITPEFVSEVTARFPESSVAKSLAAELGTQQKQQELTSNQQRLMLDAIQMKQAKGMGLTPAEESFLNSLTGQLSKREEAKPLTGTPSPFNAKEVSEQLTRAQGDVEATKRELSRLPAGDSRREIIEAEMKKAQAEVDRLSGLAGGQAPAAQPSGERPAAGQAEEGPYPPTFTPPVIKGLSDAERNARMQAWQDMVQKTEAEYATRFNQMRPLASDANYSSIKSEYETAIDLMKEHPQIAKKVFNTLRGNGDFLSQVLTAAQTGLGVNLGNMVANVSIPSQAFISAGFNKEEQLLADRLIKAFLATGGAKLAAQGLSPQQGQATYQTFLEGTKANLTQNAATALNNIQKDYTLFKQNKKLFNQIEMEHSRQTASGSPTPYVDVFRNSPHIKRINEDAEKEMKAHDRDYSAMIKEVERRRLEKSKPR